MNRNFLFILLIFLFSTNLHSQNYLIDGDAFGIPPFSNSCPSDTCFTLTPDLTWKKGAVYNKDFLNLSLPFDGTFCLFLGRKDSNGADGFAFVLKDTSVLLLGLAGGGIGYGSLSPTVAIEFDTWDNGGHDIPEDHTSLNYNGNSFIPIVPSTPLIPSGADVENGVPHTARIVWTPHDTTLYMFFDNVLRFTHQVDLVNTIFGGKTLVNWGFTSSTGGSSNLQQICFPAKPIHTFYDTICQDSCVNFNQLAYDPYSSYSWNNGISDTLPSALLCPDSSLTYYIFKHNNLTRMIDTIAVHIFVEPTPELDLGNDIVLCDGSILLDATIDEGISYQWNDGSEMNSILTSDTGMYWVEAKTEFCSVKDTVLIKCLALPNVFSPNGDGIHDYFSPFEYYTFSEGSFYIYNRWGTIVFEATDVNSIKKGWNGRLNNKGCSEGVYYFTFTYSDNSHTELTPLKGALHLFR